MSGIQGKIAAGFRGTAGPATAALGDEVNKNTGPFQSALGKLGGFAKGAGIAIAGGMAAGAAGLAALTTKAVMSAAELEQQLGGSEAVFGKYAKTIQDTAKQAYATAGLSQQEFLQGANKMGSLFQGAGFDVKSSMEMSSESMQRASDIASIMGISTTDALEAVTGMAKGNFTMMDNLGVAMNDTAIGAYAAAKGINKTTQQMSIQEKVGLAQQMFMEKTAKYAGNYAKENQTLSGSLNTTKKAFDNLLAGQGDIDGFIDSLLNTIEIAIPQITAMLPKIVQGLGAVLSALVPALSKALPTLIPALIKAVQDLLNALIAAMPSIIQVLLKALPLLINAFIQLFMAILKALPQIVTIISEAIPQIVDAIVNTLTKPKSLQEIILGAITLLIAIVKAIPVIISALAKAIPTIIKNIIATLTSSQFIGAMMNAGVKLLQAVISGIASMIGSLGRMVGRIISTVAKTLSPGNLLRIGVDMVKGLWNGIQSMGGWIKDNIINWVKDKIPGPVKKVLGIQSPSKLFASFGKDTVRGYAQGVVKNAGLAANAVTSMADQAITAAVDPGIRADVAFAGANAVQPGAGGGNRTNQTVTIGTVALGDASAVKEFFRQLNQDTINVGMGLTPIQGAQG